MSISSGLMRVLQTRINSNYQAQSAMYYGPFRDSNYPFTNIWYSNPAVPHTEYKAPPPFEPLSLDILKDQIGLVHNFFLAKLHANGDEPLIEDEDLPIKQRAPKPRLPPTVRLLLPANPFIPKQGLTFYRAKSLPRERGQYPGKVEIPKRKSGQTRHPPWLPSPLLQVPLLSSRPLQLLHYRKKTMELFLSLKRRIWIIPQE